MSEAVIFIIGAFVFAVTVYGVVMAGGLALSRIELEENPDRKAGIEQGDPKKRFPFKMKY